MDKMRAMVPISNHSDVAPIVDAGKKSLVCADLLSGNAPEVCVSEGEHALCGCMRIRCFDPASTALRRNLCDARRQHRGTESLSAEALPRAGCHVAMSTSRETNRQRFGKSDGGDGNPAARCSTRLPQTAHRQVITSPCPFHSSRCSPK